MAPRVADSSARRARAASFVTAYLLLSGTASANLSAQCATFARSIHLSRDVPYMRLVWLYTKIRLLAKKSHLRTCRIVGHLRCVLRFVASGSRTTALRSTEIAVSLSCTLNANKYRQQATRCKRRCSRDNKSQAPRQTAHQIQHPSSGGNKYSSPPPQLQAPRQPRATKPRDASGDS